MGVCLLVAREYSLRGGGGGGKCPGEPKECGRVVERKTIRFNRNMLALVVLRVLIDRIEKSCSKGVMVAVALVDERYFLT